MTIGRCPLRFDHEDGRLPIPNSSTDQRVALLICRRLPFLNRQSFFDDGTG